MNLHNLVEKYGTDKNASGYTIFMNLCLKNIMINLIIF